jgi:hypothetical protein
MNSTRAVDISSQAVSPVFTAFTRILLERR